MIDHRIKIRSGDDISRPAKSAGGVDVAERLREEIITGRIAPGTPLRQSELGRAFGVSRTPVREALHKLAAWGLVDLIVNRGAIVRRIRRPDYASAFVVWAEMAALATELAAARPDQVVERLREAVEQQRLVVEVAAECGDQSGKGKSWREQWTAADELFHGAILAAAGSSRVSEAVDATSSFFPRGTHWDSLRGRPHAIRRAAVEHLAVLRFVERGDPRRAGDAMRAHILSFGDSFLEWWDTLDTEDQPASKSEVHVLAVQTKGSS